MLICLLLLLQYVAWQQHHVLPGQNSGYYYGAEMPTDAYANAQAYSAWQAAPGAPEVPVPADTQQVPSPACQLEAVHEQQAQQAAAVRVAQLAPAAQAMAAPAETSTMPLFATLGAAAELSGTALLAPAQALQAQQPLDKLPKVEIDQEFWVGILLRFPRCMGSMSLLLCRAPSLPDHPWPAPDALAASSPGPDLEP
jgi:hypothetical protein